MDSYDNASPKKGFTVGKLVKWLLALITISVYVLLTLRACALDGMKDTSKTRNLIWNDTALQAYTTSPDSFAVNAFEPTNDTTSDGTLTITNIRWIPSISQLQLTIRYNNSLARVISEEFAMESLPEGEFLTFAIRDDMGNVYTSYEYITDSIFVYNFRRLVFDGIEFDKISSLSLEAYYIGYVDFDNSSAPLNRMTVYDAAKELDSYELKGNDLPSGTVTPNLLQSRVWVKKDNSENN